ncbi:Nuclease SbcCD subunit D [Meiothermus luteus]|uniref:Nuclease SbcCD subunit D n=1 Tax=Meiothermus luteus TaxID=2026184 RepID=A0A399EHW1_9DEIN|nr:DNA repair exonuclease [Meiothermus luteus]RIH82820.1 Nuclease SbcCD subunit D [Meiothermus luteus]
MNRPIRILHTADWHLGKELKGKDRTPEIVQALEAIAELAVERGVDLVLATGDLLDHPQPSSAAEGALVDFVLRLHKEGIACFLIAGNHDPGERFERVCRPLLEGKAEVRGRLALADEGGLVEFHGLRFALVPFVLERRLVKTLEDKGEERRAAYGERMGRLLAHFGADVVLGHFPVAGSRPGGGEFALYLADTYAVPPGMLPSARYIALGHLHRMQEVAP